MNPLLEVGAAATAVAAVIALLALIHAKIVRPVARGLRQASEFLEDWRGKPARPGVAAERGVMERLESVEYKAARAEFHGGNGNEVSMRSVVDDIDRRTADLDARTTYLESTVSRHHPDDPRR